VRLVLRLCVAVARQGGCIAATRVSENTLAHARSTNAISSSQAACTHPPLMHSPQLMQRPLRRQACLGGAVARSAQQWQVETKLLRQQALRHSPHHGDQRQCRDEMLEPVEPLINRVEYLQNIAERRGSLTSSLDSFASAGAASAVSGLVGSRLQGRQQKLSSRVTWWTRLGTEENISFNQHEHAIFFIYLGMSCSLQYGAQLLARTCIYLERLAISFCNSAWRSGSSFWYLLSAVLNRLEPTNCG